MLNKDDRHAKSILAALHDLTAAVQSSHDQQVRGVSAQKASNTEDHTPKGLSSVKDSLDALMYATKTQAEETKTFQRQSLQVQWLLLFAIVSAFVAAGIYANIARLQKTTMDTTLGQIQKQVATAEVANNLARRTLQSAIDADRP